MKGADCRKTKHTEDRGDALVAMQHMHALQQKRAACHDQQTKICVLYQTQDKVLHMVSATRISCGQAGSMDTCWLIPCGAHTVTTLPHPCKIASGAQSRTNSARCKCKVCLALPGPPWLPPALSGPLQPAPTMPGPPRPSRLSLALPCPPWPSLARSLAPSCQRNGTPSGPHILVPICSSSAAIAHTP